MDVDVASVTLKFARPVSSAFGTLTDRELLLVRLAGDDGIIGWGEAAPLEPYDGVSLGAVRQALDAYAPVLRSLEPTADVLEACRAQRDLRQVLAGIDLAV